MEKTRATTIQQKLGFMDDDLKTPKHDEIMLWASSHALEIVTAIVDNRWTDRGIEWLNEDLRKHGEPTIALADLPPRKPLEIASVVWEHPIMSKQYVIGFIDLAIWYIEDGLSLDCQVYTWEIHHHKREYPLCIEVKSSISAASELIRQIQLYRQYQRGTYVVVSPDARYADVLKSQGIEFYHYQVGAYEEAMR